MEDIFTAMKVGKIRRIPLARSTRNGLINGVGKIHA